MQVSIKTKYKFGKPERAITDGQCRDTGNIGYKTHNQKQTIQKVQYRKLKKMSYMDPTNKPGVHTCTREQ